MYIDNPCHMSKMSSTQMLVKVKTHQQSSTSSESLDQFQQNLVCSFRDLSTAIINHDTVTILTYIRVRSI